MSGYNTTATNTNKIRNECATEFFEIASEIMDRCNVIAGNLSSFASSTRNYEIRSGISQASRDFSSCGSTFRNQFMDLQRIIRDYSNRTDSIIAKMITQLTSLNKDIDGCIQIMDSVQVQDL